MCLLVIIFAVQYSKHLVHSTGLQFFGIWLTYLLASGLGNY